MSNDKYDLIIIGSGPAGLSAAIYSSRYNLRTLALGMNQGGTITDAHKVCNFPSQPEVNGAVLGKKMKSHAEKYGAEVKMGLVDEIEKKKDGFSLKTNLEEEYFAKNILFATGTERRKLNLDREDEFMGSGVSYCATCDGKFFEGKEVGVVGGGNAAATAALYLADMAEKVYIIYRGGKLKAVNAWKEEIQKTENIEVIYSANVETLLGEDRLEGISLDNGKELVIQGLFIEIGSVPKTELAESLGVELDKGYIKVGPDQKTNVDSVWAAGDMTTNSNYFKQAITASAEGAIAANDIYTEIKSSN
ncbi:MAG: NAD(P)/FAD-dependent oxidoreductase [Patescibacteria group bacterium]